MAELFFLIFSIVGGTTLIIGGLFYFLIIRPRHFYEVSGALDLVLYRILVARDEIPKAGENKNPEHRDIIRTMEQFYAALGSIETSWWHDIKFGSPSLILEAALPHVGEEVVFYVSVPRGISNYFINQIQALFPSSKIDEAPDYNIFHPKGTTAGSIAVLKKNALLSLRTVEDLGKDPLEVLIGAFAKLKKVGDGAALQLIIRPTRSPRHSQGTKAAKRLREGESPKDVFGGAGREFQKMIIGSSPKKNAEDKPRTPADDELAKQIENKASLPAFDVNIRLLVSAPTPNEAMSILQGLEATFVQYINPQGNEIGFRRPLGKMLENLVYEFSFRLYNARDALYLSSAELASMFHFPYAGFSQSNVQYLKSREAPPPVELANDGLMLGDSIYRGQKREVFITEDDRRRHMYVIGQTGTGKSTLLKEMARQDIIQGHGVCFIDPHGQDVESLLESVPANRIDDVIYFNPADTERPIGLNFLEYDTRYPEQKTTIVNELLDIFNKLYNMSVAGGPMFEQYFRNATLLVMEDPASGNTLLEIERVLVDKEYRDYKLSRSSNIVVGTFWKKIAEKATGEASLQNMVPYITSKFDTFLANDIMRPIIAQEHTTIRFREAMDQQKIILINLSKGRLGELNSSLLGHIIVGKILIAALSRSDMPEGNRRDFYFYIDEFQNVTTKSIATILSEARKYRLNLIIAHQFLGQLEEEIRKAVFGNVGTMVAFRIGTEDGEVLEKQFSPVFSARDLINIDNYNAYAKLLIHGETSRAFNIKIVPPAAGSSEIREEVVRRSREKYGRVRAEVETEIKERYRHV